MGEIKEEVRSHYAELAEQMGGPAGCCTSTDDVCFADYSGAGLGELGLTSAHSLDVYKRQRIHRPVDSLRSPCVRFEPAWGQAHGASVHLAGWCRADQTGSPPAPASVRPECS